ncbi:hypothetical protein [Rahnella sp. PD4]|uniref:hypothetical protein n=1 Tax=Rahnella sp. PD4 TaxID=3368611 RepID=UPI003BA044DA
MSVTSQDFISFASTCIQRNDEIGYRNAIGRAYYGAYHHTIAKLVNGPKQSHADLITYLQGAAWQVPLETFDKKKMIALSHVLFAMKSQRTLSDYKLHMNIDKAKADLAMTNAANALKIVDSL